MQTLDAELKAILNDAVADIRRRSQQAGQVATGRTLRALEVRVRAEGGKVIGEIWGNKYTGALETGSRPARKRGTDEQRQQMIANLKEWCRVRGLSTGMTDKQTENLARYLAWYIKKYGTRLYRNGGRRDIITPAIEFTRNAVNERMSLYYEQLISDNIDNNFFKRD